MSREDAETTPMIELAEMLIENVEEFFEREAEEIATTWDRCDLINELENADMFSDED
jgi:hypothetical protein